MIHEPFRNVWCLNDGPSCSMGATDPCKIGAKSSILLRSTGFVDFLKIEVYGDYSVVVCMAVCEAEGEGPIPSSHP
jgi:hypothetical protein